MDDEIIPLPNEEATPPVTKIYFVSPTADTPKKLSTAIIHLAQNPQEQEKLAKQAAEQLQNLYNPSKMLVQRMNIYRQLAKRNTSCS